MANDRGISMMRSVATAAFVLAMGMSTAVTSGFEEPASEKPTSQPASQPAEPEGVDAMKIEAAALMPSAESSFLKRFLGAVERLPRIGARKLYVYSDRRTAISEAAYKKLAESEREAYTERESSETLYYYTRYGSPLAYSRVLEILAKHEFGDLTGQRVLDFGYGSVGHLRLMAECGVDAVGVDVDPFLTALYSEKKDQGAVPVASGRAGKVTLVEGRWPSEEGVIKAVGGGFDVITSKNTLKNGYLHPEKEVDPRMLVDLGVSDEDFVNHLNKALKPGGVVLIYNICPAPAPADKPYIPWADGRCPFSKEMWEKGGFKVLAFDEDDSKAVRRMGRLLGWDKGDRPMDLENDLSASFTIVQKARRAP